MPASLPVRIAALERDVADFHARTRHLAQRAPAGSLTPDSPAVDRAFAEADRLVDRAASIVATRGWRELGRADMRRAIPTVMSGSNAARTATQLLGTGPSSHIAVTASSTDPRSAHSARTWLDAAGGRDLPDVRIVGSIPPPAARLVGSRLAHLPERVVRQLDAQGRRSTLFSGRLTDVHGFRSLRGVQPRGWPEGATWDDVPGVGTATGLAANPNRERIGSGHGTMSLALHELGHVVDVALARPSDRAISEGRSWLRGPMAEAVGRGALDPYTSSYPEEWFAEAMLRYVRTPQSHASLARWYPKTFAYLERELGRPRFD